MSDAVACEAVLSVYRKSRDGIVVSFVIHPNEVPNELALAPIGQRFALGLGMLTDEAEKQQPPKAFPTGGEDEMTRARKRAVILCEDERFHGWVSRKGGPIITTPAAAADWLRTAIQADSRRSIATSTEVFEAFRRIEDSYRADTGLTTERR